ISPPSLPDALPISVALPVRGDAAAQPSGRLRLPGDGDRTLRGALSRGGARSGAGIPHRGRRARREGPWADRDRGPDRAGRVADPVSPRLRDERFPVVDPLRALSPRRVAGVPCRVWGAGAVPRGEE